MLNPRKLYNKKGFSLVELIIVIAIIAILAVAIIPNAGRWITNARRSSAMSNLSTTVSSVEAETVQTSIANIDLATLQTYGVNDKQEDNDTDLTTLVYTGAQNIENGTCILFYKGNDYVIVRFYGTANTDFVLYDSTGTRQVTEDVSGYTFSKAAA